MTTHLKRTVEQVYEEYKGHDAMFSNQNVGDWAQDAWLGSVVYDLWHAIKGQIEDEKGMQQ